VAEPAFDVVYVHARHLFAERAGRSAEEFGEFVLSLLRAAEVGDVAALEAMPFTGRRIPVRQGRVAISWEIREHVLRRDGGRCVDCRATDYLELDHIVPVSQGGSTAISNLQTRCRRCNIRKGPRRGPARKPHG
jgi:hypothetical protein